MKHFASQEDTVMMIHMYLQILQQYNIDLNLSCLRQISSSPMEDRSNVFSHFHVPLCHFHRLTRQNTQHRLHLAPTHVNLFFQSICTTSPAIPLHLGKDILTVLSSSCNFSTCTTWQMSDLWARKPCPSAFFPPKNKQTPESVSSPFLTLTYTKTQLLPS